MSNVNDQINNEIIKNKYFEKCKVQAVTTVSTARVNFHIYFDRVVMAHLETRFYDKYDVEKEVITSGSSTRRFFVPVDPGALHLPSPRYIAVTLPFDAPGEVEHKRKPRVNKTKIRRKRKSAFTGCEWKLEAKFVSGQGLMVTDVSGVHNLPSIYG